MKPLSVLVKKAKKGDGDAFVTLVKQYEQVLYKVAGKLLKNEEDVADALQDAIMAAFEKIETLKNAEHFNTWICKILINKCNRILAKKKNLLELTDSDVFQQKAPDPQLKLDVEDQLNTLNHDYKTAIVMYYIVGMNIKEIAEFLKEPEGTIKSRLSRAKAMLKNNYHRGVCEVEPK